MKIFKIFGHFPHWIFKIDKQELSVNFYSISVSSTWETTYSKQKKKRKIFFFPKSISSSP